MSAVPSRSPRTPVVVGARRTSSKTFSASRLQAAAKAQSLGNIKLSKAELAEFTTQLAVMTRTGLDVASALASQIRFSRSPNAAALFGQVHDDVLAGKPLSKALAKHERSFGASYVATLAAGESSGSLPQVLEQLSHLLQSELELRAKVRGMLAYPAILTSVSIMVVSGLVLFVLPQFATIFEQQGVALPVITQGLLAIADFLSGYLWIWVPSLVAILASIQIWRSSESGRTRLDAMYLQLPIIREFLRRLYVARFCRLLGMMTCNGVPILESLEILRRSLPNRVYQRLMTDIEESVVNGGSLTDPLVAASFVPAAAAEMLATGERTGALGNVALTLADHYDREAEARLKETITFVEPAVTLVLGVIVSLVVLAVALPMFDMANLDR